MAKKKAAEPEASKKQKKGTGSGTKKKKNAVDTPEQAAARAEIREMQEKRSQSKRMNDVIAGLVLIAIGAFIFIAVKFQAAGEFGNAMGEVLRGVFGLIGLVFPWYLIAVGILLIFNRITHLSLQKTIVCILIVLLMCILNSARFIDAEHLIYAFGAFYRDGIDLAGGGLFGMTFGVFLITLFGKSGLYLFSAVALIICLLLLLNNPLMSAYKTFKNRREEKRIMKERELDYVAPVMNEQMEMDMDPIPTPSPVPVQAQEIPARTPLTQMRPPRKSSRRTSDFTLPEEIAEPHEIRIITPYDEPEKPAQKKGKGSNVLDFIKGGDPFSDSSSVSSGKGLGLDGETKQKKGFGLDGEPEAEPVLDIKPYEAEKTSAADIAKGAAEIGHGLGLADGAAALTKSVDKSSVKKYKKPPVDLLNTPTAPNGAGVSDDLKKKAKLLEDTLRSFNVDAKVVQVTQGPAVTRYEIQPNVGVKVSKISSLANDIALNLRARNIRIEAPIPGKAAVGIEVENDHINMVTIREIIDSKEFKSAKSKIEFAVGKDIAGKPIVADLKSMPHLLIAGSTGSGKSVCINSIITSILYKANPDEVKLVMIDPKVVELGNYNGIPHLLIPVVTDPAKAAAALSWAVVEMTNRYKLFAETNVRDLSSYNKKMREERHADQVMPQVVIIIDELADLMIAAPSQVEQSICRIAQMARAAGMHLIVATQRPSVDVITGVIKANIPSRIAFAVSSQVDSRTILDMAGAEKLMGKGDMLFNPLGMGKPVRVQGTFISDDEVERVIDHVKSQVTEAEYSDEVIDTIENGGGSPFGEDDEADELLADAIECVVMQGQASVSMLQRRFRIGYNRAARIVDEMEARGIVGPQDGSRPRQVLMTEEELQQLKEDTQGM